MTHFLTHLFYLFHQDSHQAYPLALEFLDLSLVLADLAVSSCDLREKIVNLKYR